MFVWHEVPLAIDFPAAKEKFTLLVHGGWLDSVSQDAYSEGLSGLLRVGPFGGGAGPFQAGQAANPGAGAA